MVLGLISEVTENVAGVPPWVLLTGQIFTMIGAVAAAFLGYKAVAHSREGAEQATQANLQATQANDAVNHAHATGQDRLFDMVVETRERTRALDEWKDRWDGLPEQLSNADGLVTHFAVVEDRIETSARGVHRRIDDLERSNSASHDETNRILNDHIARTEPILDSLTTDVAMLKAQQS